MQPIPALSCRPVVKAQEAVSRETAAAKLSAFLEQARRSPLARGSLFHLLSRMTAGL